VVWQRLAIQRQEFGLQPYHVTAMQTLRLEKGHPQHGNDLHERWVGYRAGSGRQGRPRVATATTTPFFDPQGMRLRA
jgi:glycine cleavage system aminomethyltransferase T